ncbi:hypothetical protein D9M73_246830 [compost metagenome]
MALMARPAKPKPQTLRANKMSHFLSLRSDSKPPSNRPINMATPSKAIATATFNELPVKS